MDSESITFTGAGCLLFHRSRLVLEIRKVAKWEHVPGQPTRIGLGGIGGTIEEGETPLQALYREATEEIGCSISVFPSPRGTACVTPGGIKVLTGFEIDGLSPAMIWEVGDPTYVVGSYVAVFLARVDGDPQPDDLPAIVLTDPDLIPKIGFESMSVQEVMDTGAEIRTNVDLPFDGRLILANTMRHLVTVSEAEPSLFDEWMREGADISASGRSVEETL